MELFKPLKKILLVSNLVYTISDDPAFIIQIAQDEITSISRDNVEGSHCEMCNV